MNTTIQTQPFYSSQSNVAALTAPKTFVDAARELKMPAKLPDPGFESSQHDASPQAPRRMRPLRFAIGLVLTTIGIVMILLTGVSMLEAQQPGESSALPLVAIGILSGVMLLGGGFGLMASASSGFDEQEFDRLMKAGNIASAEMEQRPTETC